MATQLLVRSAYSLLSSMCTVEGIVSKCKTLGYKSVALVDKNILMGAMSFSKECKKAEIKPIFGLEFDLKVEDRDYPCILYAKDNEGFKNLMGLSSKISCEGLESISLEILSVYKKHNILVLLSDDCPLTYVIDKGMDGDDCLNKMKDYFGEDYLVGLVDHDIALNANRDVKIKEVLKKHNIKTIALSRTYYLDADDAYEYEILKCIRDKRILGKDVTLQTGRHFLSKDEFLSMYNDEDIKNTDVLASLCNVDINFKTELPKYDAPNGASSKDYLVSLARVGLQRRLHNNVTKEYSSRLEYELDIILKMHFEDYFLIVYDFVLYSKKKEIMVGPARGSAGSSLVAYCLGITDIDPIKYKLLFERFLNPERISMPDIDIDFPDDRRNEVIEYVKNKYGVDHIGHIITYGTLKTKQVLRDVGRVLNYSTKELDNITKLIPTNSHVSLFQAYNNIPLFRQKIESEKKYRDLFYISKKLEGLPRLISTHAAGIVFSKGKINDVVPMIRIESDIYSTQYTAEYLEEIGLIKIDFLSLRNLNIISKIVDDIKASINPNFDIKAIPLNDEKTYKLIADAALLGVFQLKSNGIKNLISKMKPKTLEELSKTLALFRPGSMENASDFLLNREDPNRIKYSIPELKPILDETYGVIVYQEQIMMIARAVAGFTYGKADVLRRAMSKKKLSELEKLEPDFINGCIKNGYSKENSQAVYDLILKFANYGFNKSHSIAYGLISYELAYLKANYSLYFYKTLLNETLGSESKTYEYIKECEKQNVKVKAVSINNSDLSYKIIDGAIFMPFSVIKNMDFGQMQKIKEEQDKGKFTDYLETVCRLTRCGIEKSVIENLIYAGAFDEFKHSRNTMIVGLSNTLKYASIHTGEIGNISSFDDKPILEELNENKPYFANKEKDVLGYFFSFNPIVEYKKEHSINVPSLANAINSKGEVTGFGQIKRIYEHRTRRGELMAFVDVTDYSTSLSLAIMPNLYKKYRDLFEKDKYLIFSGRLDNKESILVQRLIIKDKQ